MESSVAQKQTEREELREEFKDSSENPLLKIARILSHELMIMNFSQAELYLDFFRTNMPDNKHVKALDESIRGIKMELSRDYYNKTVYYSQQLIDDLKKNYKTEEVPDGAAVNY